MIQEHELVQEWKRRNIRYALPALSGEVATTAQRKYRPRPASSILGITVALTVIGLWALLFWHALFHVKLPDGRREHSSWPHILAVFFALEFLYTGLFISCHDAMHGTICADRRLNDFLGQLAISLYAWFDYDMLHRKHWEHHNNTGLVGADPDFHHGDPSLPSWFVSFMLEYMSIWQFTKIAWWALLVQAMGCPIQNMLMYMTAAPLLSAFRLFYYGTYVPHHPEPGPKAGHQVMSWTQSRTSQASRIVSFFSCYHFDMHWEHHRWPYAPWWDLPLCRQLSGRGPAGKLSACAAAPLGSTLENS